MPPYETGKIASFHLLYYYMPDMFKRLSNDDFVMLSSKPPNLSYSKQTHNFKAVSLKYCDSEETLMAFFLIIGIEYVVIEHRDTL